MPGCHQASNKLPGSFLTHLCHSQMTFAYLWSFNSLKHQTWKELEAWLVPSRLHVLVISWKSLAGLCFQLVVPGFYFPVHSQFLVGARCLLRLCESLAWRKRLHKYVYHHHPDEGGKIASLLPKIMMACSSVQLVFWNPRMSYCCSACFSVLIHSYSIFSEWVGWTDFQMFFIFPQWIYSVASFHNYGEYYYLI